MRAFLGVLDSSARLLKLLSLMQARADWTGPELAARLEVGVRTVRRDVERLRTLGYPVHAAPGVAGGYRLGAGASLPPLLLDEEEAVAVAVALRTAASASVTGIEETALRALAKLEGVLPPPLRRRVTAVGSAVVPYPSFGARVDSGLLALLATAIRDRERLRLRYRDHAGTPTRRLVEPHRLVLSGRRWYLVAWDAGREDWRTFRVDRIEPAPSSAGRFLARQPPAADIAAYVARGVSAARDTHQVRVLLHAQLATVAPRVPAAGGTLEAVDESSCLLSAGADWLGGLAIYVAGIGVDFEVLDPPEFAAEIRRLAERFTRAVEG
ncbi:MAG TPA: YafY family protein [Solirubrobacteraceae bacterium]|nr:YafY family protein [Solirubrobacteraceae bacterium]